eukprot:3671027-Amphidinium_carterae.1
MYKRTSCQTFVETSIPLEARAAWNSVLQLETDGGLPLTRTIADSDHTFCPCQARNLLILAIVAIKRGCAIKHDQAVDFPLEQRNFTDLKQ